MCDQFQDKVTLNESRTGAAAVVTSETASDTSSTYSFEHKWAATHFLNRV